MAEKLDITWFNLNKYDAVKNFDVADWYFQLEKRQELQLSILMNNDPAERRKVGGWMHPFYEHTAKKLITLIKDKPILVNEKRKTSALSVRDTVFFDLRFANFMNNIPCNDTDLSINEIISTFPYATVSPHNAIVSDSCNPIITVDINAADAQLKRDFELWLKGIRETTDHETIKEIVTSQDIEKWIQFQVLPYLDLTLIAKAEHKKVTQSALGDLLFPSESVGVSFDRAERIRKTVQSLAESLLDGKTLTALQIQAKSGIKNT